MPQLALCTIAGEKVGHVEADDALLDVPMNRDLVHQAVLVVDSSRKRKCGRAKTRGEVDLTTAKMYRQKGLGRARHGSRAAPHFTGGGAAFPPQGTGRIRVMPRKARRLALCAALSDLARKNRVLVLDELNLAAPRTKTMVEMLAGLHIRGRAMILASRDEVQNENNYKSCRNIPGLVLRESPHLNTRDALWADYVIFTRAGLAALAGGGAENA